MSLNARMHERNPFKDNPADFVRLAQLYPDFARHCIFESNKARIDFKNADSVKSLCCTLVKDIFNYDLEIPNDHLIPRLPQRINYVLWIEDLLNRPKNARGIDIGCGSSCIFPLICCGLNKEWQMLATDISDENLKYATRNININKLENRIRLLKIESENRSIIKDVFVTNNYDYDFLMCNPPFYSNESELEGITRRPEKRPLPKSINTAQLHESVYTDGGEVGFVKKMIDESLQIRTKIKIYTTMLGRKKSLNILKSYLLEKGVKSVGETEFCQGHTMRWGLCWSLNESIKLNIKKTNLVKKETKPIQLEVDIRNELLISDFYDQLRNIFLNELKLELLNENKKDQMCFRAYENTWSRQRQKRRAEMKRLKLNSEYTSKLETEIKKDKELIEFKFNLNEINSNKIRIELNGLNENDFDSSSKEILNQIIQYLRNKLCI